VLQPSTVQVLARGDGSVISATLLTRSGLAAADQRALDLARAAQFAPLTPPADSRRFQWGRLVFLWHAIEPAPAPPPAAVPPS
jgi:TonB family protein